MPTRPTKRQILDKYRDLIDTDDFDLLVADDLPNPELLRQEASWLESLGTVEGFWLFLKRKFGKPIQIVALYGSFWVGLNMVNDHVIIAYHAVYPWLDYAMQQTDEIATGYAVAGTKQRPYPEKAFFTESLTTTTTTASPRTAYDLPDSLGLVPYSGRWPSFS